MNGITQKSPGPRAPTYRPRRSTMARSHCLATRGESEAIAPRTMPARIQSGSSRNPATRQPATVPAARRITPNTLTRNSGGSTTTRFRLKTPELGMGLLLHLLLKLSDEFFACEPAGCGVLQHAGGKVLQCLTAKVLLWSCARGLGDEGPDSSARFDDATSFEFRVDFCDCIGVDAEVDRELTYGGQLGAFGQSTCSDGCTDSPFDLEVDWRPVGRIEPDEISLGHFCSIVLVK